MFDLKAVRLPVRSGGDLDVLIKNLAAKVTELQLITNSKAKKEKSAGFFFRSFAEAPERLTNPTLFVRPSVF